MAKGMKPLNHWRLSRILVPLYIITIMMCIPVGVNAAGDDEPGEALIFDIQSAIGQAMEHNPSYRRATLALEIAEYDFDYNAAIFDGSFQAKTDYSSTRTGGLSFESQVLSGSGSNILNGQMSYSDLLPAGDTFSLSYGNKRSQYFSSLAGGDSGATKSYTSVLGFTWNKPLLKGFGSTVTMAGINRSEIDLLISQSAAKTAEDNLKYGVRLAYLRVAASREAVGVAEASLAEAQSLLDETKAKVKAGALSSYSEIAAEAGMYTRQQELLNAKGEYEKSLNGLRELLGLDDNVVIEIAPGLEIPMPEIDADTAIERALDARPDVLQLKDRLTRAEVDYRVARNSMKPELAFNGGGGVQGESLEFLKSIGEMKHISWFAGLTYTVPLGGNQAAKAQAEIARLAMDDLDLQLEGLEDAIRREVSDAIVDWQNAGEKVKVAEAGLEAAKAKIESDRKRFELGLITSGDLLTYEKEYTQAQFNVIQAHVDLLGSLALLVKLTSAG